MAKALAANKDLKGQVEFHHIHMTVANQKAGQAWYMKELGAGDGSAAIPRDPASQSTWLHAIWPSKSG